MLSSSCPPGASLQSARRSERTSGRWLAAGLAALAALGCNARQELAIETPYDAPPSVTRVSDRPLTPSAPDAGQPHQKQPSGCAPESPPKFCRAITDCKSGDICISYTCEPACFSQCGDYPPGLPGCPNPLFCQSGVCVPPVQVTNGSATQGTATGSVTATAGQTSGGATTNGTGTASGGNGPTGGSSTGAAAGTTTAGTTTTGGAASTTGGGSTTGGPPPPTCTDPDLSGDWTQNSTYQIASGVANGYPGLLGVINEVSNFLNTWSYAFAIPPWVGLIFSDLTGFDALFQNLQVQADMQLTALPGNPSSYTCTETWQQVNVVINGVPAQLQPQASYNSPNPYEVDTCSGTTTFQNHDLSGAVTGLIPPLLDAIVQADCEAQGCSYSTFADFLEGAIMDLIDCSQLNDGSIFGQLAQGACDAAESAVVSDVENAIAQIPLGIGICNVQASVPTAPMTLSGSWQGSLAGTAFPGTLAATQN